MKLKELFKLLCNLFFSLRPVLLIPVWGFSIFGYYRATNASLLPSWETFIKTPLYVYFEILLFSVSVGTVYLLNQLADIEVDKKNGGLPLIASGIVSVKSAWILSWVTGIIAVGFPVIIGKYYLSWLSLVTIIIGILYSFKPFFFSGRPFFDFLSNATGYGIVAFGAGWCIGGNHFFSCDFFSASLPYFLLMACGSINSTFPDVSGDKECGKNTTSVVFGVKLSHIFSTVILVCAAILSIFEKDYLALSCSVLSLPLYLIFIFYKSQKIMESTYKVGGALCMIAAFYVLPVFMIISCCVFFLTRIYFQICHEISYPSMVPSQKKK